MSEQTEQTQEESKLESAAKQNEIYRQENSDFADERVVEVRSAPVADQGATSPGLGSGFG
jgi:hypothetical protein